MSPNLKAFLDMVAWSELGPGLLAKSDNGYDVLVGSTAKEPFLFNSYATHPCKSVYLPQLNIWSTAAGRYQLLCRYWKAYSVQLKLLDFSPRSQDLIAIQQIRERRALDLIESGNLTTAVALVRNIWASLPGAGYGQHEQTLAGLQKAYENAGGMVA